MSLRKLARTLQNIMPVDRDAKETAMRWFRLATRTPVEADYQAVRYLPEDSLMLDVGANHGQSILSIRMFARKAQIVSFEPNGLLAGRIQRIWREDRLLTVQAVGLSDVEGTFELFVPVYRGMVYDGLASFDETTAREWLCSETLYGFDPAKLKILRIKCSVRCLDSFSFSRAPAFIKRDVQGFEYKALIGGRQLIEASLPVLLIEGPDGDPRIAEMLAKIGYKQYRYDGKAFQARMRGTLNSFFMTAPSRYAMAVRGAVFVD